MRDGSPAAAIPADPLGPPSQVRLLLLRPVAQRLQRCCAVVGICTVRLWFCPSLFGFWLVFVVVVSSRLSFGNFEIYQIKRSLGKAI